MPPPGSGSRPVKGSEGNRNRNRTGEEPQMTAGPADRVRNAPLPAVAELLGYRRDPRDRRRWRRPGSIISISGARFNGNQTVM